MKGGTVVTGDVGWKGIAALEALVDRTLAALPVPPPKEVDVAGLKAALAAGGSVLDVRNPDETAAARVPGAVLIPLDDLQARLGELERFRGRDLYVICKSGGRSAKAAQFLASEGHQPVNVAGGTLGWIAAGNDVLRG
ncbi:MAG: rhodanese-like domain-containing protein [Myxococcales bacterium]|nr:rhodanese-like domain-containing protein [Myxococcales bacterium]